MHQRRAVFVYMHREVFLKMNRECVHNRVRTYTGRRVRIIQTLSGRAGPQLQLQLQANVEPVLTGEVTVISANIPDSSALDSFGLGTLPPPPSGSSARGAAAGGADGITGKGANGSGAVETATAMQPARKQNEDC